MAPGQSNGFRFDRICTIYDVREALDCGLSETDVKDLTLICLSSQEAFRRMLDDNFKFALARVKMVAKEDIRKLRKKL